MSKVFMITKEGYTTEYIYVADDIMQVISAFKHEFPATGIKSIEILHKEVTVLSK